MGKLEGRWEKGDRRKETGDRRKDTGDRRRETGAGGQLIIKITAKHEPAGTAHEYFKVLALLGRKNMENMIRLKIQYISALNEPKRHL